jgi:hypothetical protein
MKKNIMLTLGILFHFGGEVMDVNGMDHITGFLFTSCNEEALDVDIVTHGVAWRDTVAVKWDDGRISAGSVDWAKEVGVTGLETGNSIIGIHSGKVFALPHTEARNNDAEMLLAGYSRSVLGSYLITFVENDDNVNESVSLEQIADKILAMGLHVGIIEENAEIQRALTGLGINL